MIDIALQVVQQERQANRNDRESPRADSPENRAIRAARPPTAGVTMR